MYRGLVSFGSARWPIAMLSAIMRSTRGMEYGQEKNYSFLGNDSFPNLYDALVYEGKFMSEYLERQIYETVHVNEQLF